MGKTIFGTILNTKVNKDGRIFVKVEYQGDPLGFEAKEDVKQDTINTDSLRFKVTKANQSSPSSVKATENYSAIIGSSTNRIVSSNKYGNIIAGPVVFTCTSGEYPSWRSIQNKWASYFNNALYYCDSYTSS